MESSCLKALTNPILKHVLEHLDLFDIQRLRKVSRGIRKCVDEVNPDPKIKSISIEGIKSDQFDLEIESNNKAIQIEYAEHWRGCSVRVQNKSMKTFKSQNFLGLLLADIGSITRNETAVIEALTLNFSYKPYISEVPRLSKSDHKSLNSKTLQVLSLLKESLLSRQVPLRAKDFCMNIASENEVMDVLPCLDEKVLENIELRSSPRGSPMKFDELPKLEQWKNAKKLKMDGITVASSLQKMNLIHFEDVLLTINVVTPDEILYLKNELRKHSKLKRFLIYFKNSISEPASRKCLGKPDNSQENPFEDERKQWYFKMSTSKRVLHLLHYVSEFFVFTTIHRLSVPDGATILP